MTKKIESIISRIEESSIKWHTGVTPDLHSKEDKDTWAAVKKALGASKDSEVAQADGAEGDGPEEIDNLDGGKGRSLGAILDGGCTLLNLDGVKVVLVHDAGYRGIWVNSKDRGRVTLPLLKKHQHKGK
jgi:hypothetical protein